MEGGALDIVKSYRMMTVDDYLKELSGRKPVPGGGSASALSAAIGSALNLMVINYTLTPSGEGENTEELTLLRERQVHILERLSSLVDEDCEAFAALMTALKEGKAAQDKYMAAATVPMEICRRTRESMAIAEQVSARAKEGIATDVGCACHLLKSAFYAARLNVNINLKYIKDQVFVEDLRNDLFVMSSDIETMFRSIQAVLG
jgi:methenyltetrahydrofolate cyclohydrolase